MSGGGDEISSLLESKGLSTEKILTFASRQVEQEIFFSGLDSCPRGFMSDCCCEAVVDASFESATVAGLSMSDGCGLLALDSIAGERTTRSSATVARPSAELVMAEVDKDSR